MTDNVYRLVKIIEKDKRIIAAVQFEIELFDFFYQSKQLIDYIYTAIYCKLSECIGQTRCSYEHYPVSSFFAFSSLFRIYSFQNAFRDNVFSVLYATQMAAKNAKNLSF